MKVIAERTSAALGRRISRRSFVARGAVAATALAVAPTEFVLHPTSAYAAICSCAGQGCPCGSLCCDGYTEFCCTTTGTNACPPGTLLGGWWKVDGSSFCGGGPRYYMDCNAASCGGCGCGSGGICNGACANTACGCANGDCNNRKRGCTQFRYGQCHNEVPCLGPIVCRVVTCTPPWQIDPACGTTARSDDSTRYHDRACLHGEPFGTIDVATDVGLGTFHIGGWAIDPDSSDPIDVHVYLDGVPQVALTADGYRPDVGAAYARGDRHGYDTRIAAPPGMHSVCVYGINVGPGVNSLLACRTVEMRSNPIGAIDFASDATGAVRVAGWAIDPDSSSSIDVAFAIDGALVGAARADLVRPDIAAAFAGFGELHGFDATVPSPSGTHTICVYGINVGPGATVPIACRQVTVGSREPFGCLDTAAYVAGKIRITGWAADPDTPEPIDIHVYVNGSFTGATRADIVRPDVAAVFPAIGTPHGFDLAIASPGSGPHTVCVYAINRYLGTYNPLIGCRPVVVSPVPIGVVDAVYGGPGVVRVVGWALDPDTDGPVDIHVYIDGQLAGAATADAERPDIATAFPGFGPSHGYSFVVPAKAGTHNVCVYAINRASGVTNPLLGCRPVTSS